MLTIALLVGIMFVQHIFFGWDHLRGTFPRELSGMEFYSLRYPWEMCFFGPLEEEVTYRAGCLSIGIILFGSQSPALWVVVLMQAIWFAYRHSGHILPVLVLWHFPLGMIWGAIMLLIIKMADSDWKGILFGLAAVTLLHSASNLCAYAKSIKIAKRLRLGKRG